MVKTTRQAKASRTNAITLKKEIVTGKRHANPIPNVTLRPLKRTKSQAKQPPISSVKRKEASVRLPPIVKQAPAKPLVSKSIHTPPSEHAPERAPVPISSILRQPIPVLPKLAPIPLHLPLIKERTVHDNLTKKSTLKCKSPRPGTNLSRSTVSNSADRHHTPRLHHPLQHMDVGSLLSDAARSRLKRLFRKLDSDKDGHLSYTQVQKCLPANLPRAQMTFFHVLYEILSDATFFGLQEFYATAVIVEIVAKQDSMLWNTLLDDVDFNYYHATILELLEEFNGNCSSIMGNIDYVGFLQIILQRTATSKVDRLSMEFEYLVPMIKTMKINRLYFVTLIPAMIFMESTLRREKDPLPFARSFDARFAPHTNLVAQQYSR